MPEHRTGFVDRVTYHNPENGFAIFRVQMKGRIDLVTVIGNTTSVTAGEHVEASGRCMIDTNLRCTTLKKRLQDM